MDQARNAEFQQVLELAGKLSPEDQEILVDLIGRRMVERRTTVIDRGVAATLQAVREGRGRYRSHEGSKDERPGEKTASERLEALRRTPEIVLRDGRPTAVILDLDENQELLERLEDLDDLAMLAEMREQPLEFRRLEDFLAEHRAGV